MTSVTNIEAHRWWTSLEYTTQIEILAFIHFMYQIPNISQDSVITHTAKEFGLTIEEASYVNYIYNRNIKKSLSKNPRIRYRHFPGKHIGKDLRAAEEYRKRILEDLEFMEKAVARARAHTGKIPESLKTAIKKMFEKLENANMIIMQYRAGLKGQGMRKNPPAPAVEIYDTILAIEAIKGDGSLWPKEKFRHDFEKKSKAKVYGLPDGSLLIKSQKGKKLWKNFNGYKEGIDY